jgi:predicted nucleic acid-binding protein
MTSTVLYDAGPLIAADRNDRRFWAEHRARLELGIVPVVAAPVVAQVSRTSRQAQLRRLLRGCEVVALDEGLAHRAGALLGKARVTDVTDAVVVALAATRGPADIVTTDPDDIRRLIAAGRVSARVVAT